MNLSETACVEPKKGEAPLSAARARELSAELRGWMLEGDALRKEFRLGSFREAITFVNSVADLAEAQGHHPDIFISYKTVRLTLATHKIGGLSLNDFIVAAKIDTISP